MPQENEISEPLQALDSLHALTAELAMPLSNPADPYHSHSNARRLRDIVAAALAPKETPAPETPSTAES